jgi:hypothetical protein
MLAVTGVHMLRSTAETWESDYSITVDMRIGR